MKEIKDYLHLYLGCELQRGGKVTPDLLKAANEAAFNAWEDFKPILRPLSDMTEEERKELWFMIFKREFRSTGSTRYFKEANLQSEPRWVLSSGVERLGIELNGTVWADSDLHIWKHNQHEVTRWMLAKCFDLFNLIPEGLAIDASSLKQIN